MVRSIANNQGLMYFVTSFISVVHSILNSSPPPCFLPKAHPFLHLSKDVKIGDWFQFEYYSEIRLYGVEVAPYKIPTFVPMRLFSLEFIRQSLNLDQVHFMLTNKGHLFKFPNIVGPYIVNNMQVVGKVQKSLEDVNL